MLRANVERRRTINRSRSTGKYRLASWHKVHGAEPHNVLVVIIKLHLAHRSIVEPFFFVISFFLHLTGHSKRIIDIAWRTASSLPRSSGIKIHLFNHKKQSKCPFSLQIPRSRHHPRSLRPHCQRHCSILIMHGNESLSPILCTDCPPPPPSHPWTANWYVSLFDDFFNSLLPSGRGQVRKKSLFRN